MKLSTLRDSMEPPTRHQLGLVMTASILLLLFQLFKWPLTRLLTVFIAPFVEIAVFALFAICWTASLIHGLCRLRSGPSSRWIPFAAAVLFAALWFGVPFSDFYLDANFYLLRSPRTRIAQTILSPGPHPQFLQGRGGYVTLPASSSYLSEDGDVDVDGQFVLFFTFRGVLSRFSGFVYSPTDAPPSRDQFGGDGLQIEHLAPHWFWYAS